VNFHTLVFKKRADDLGFRQSSARKVFQIYESLCLESQGQSQGNLTVLLIISNRIADGIQSGLIIIEIGHHAKLGFVVYKNTNQLKRPSFNHLRS
jgi:hypothetical protein